MTQPTISELEQMLASKDPLDIEILPNGEIRAVPAGTAQQGPMPQRPTLPQLLHSLGPTNY